MATTEERMKILKMIEEGKLSAEEGAKLLAALRSAERSSSGSELGRSGARWLLIRVTELASGRSRATVRIPLGLIDAGLKIGARFAPEVEGVNMDQLLDLLRSGASGKIIDVTDEVDGERVEIFVE